MLFLFFAAINAVVVRYPSGEVVNHFTIPTKTSTVLSTLSDSNDYDPFEYQLVSGKSNQILWLSDIIDHKLAEELTLIQTRGKRPVSELECADFEYKPFVSKLCVVLHASHASSLSIAIILSLFASMQYILVLFFLFNLTYTIYAMGQLNRE